jgi:UDPglucose 6-dehydrogenase
MKLTIIGTGYVGLVSGTCFAEVGHHVICVDNDAAKVKMLQAGGIPIYEPGLEELIKKNTAAGRLTFSNDTAEGVAKSDVIFIAVPTPPQPDGSVDMSFIERVARDIAGAMTEYKIIVDKSTVPVQTGDKVAETIKRYCKARVEFDVVSNPEFLREGFAVEDLMKPDRVVIGVRSQRPVAAMKEIYVPFKAPIIVTDINSAELIKHASNSFLAVKISYANMVADLAEKLGADIEEVVRAVGMDPRIGPSFFHAGIGFGGFCLPKDLQAFVHLAEKSGVDFSMLKEAENINKRRIELFVEKIRRALWVVKGKQIGVLGLAFKPNTDDIRFAPAIDLIHALLKEGAVIRAYDPEAMEKARPVLQIEYGKDAYEAAEGAEALLIATEWEQFRKLDWGRVRDSMVRPLILDGRNLLSGKEMKGHGFEYYSMGRPD